MDPNKTLDDLRKLMARAHRYHVEGASLPDDLAGQIVETFEALDTWLVNGGFLPALWCTTERPS